MTTTQVTTKRTKIPAHINDSVRGLENINADSVDIPRLQLVQKQSEAIETHDVKPGDIINSITGHNYGNSIHVCTFNYAEKFPIWKHFDHGGGFVKHFDTLQEANAELVHMEPADHYYVRDTSVYGVLIIDPKTGEFENSPALIEMVSSNRPVARKWNSQILAKQLDRFACIWKVESVTKSNAKYKTLQVTEAGFTPEAAYKAAEELYKQHS